MFQNAITQTKDLSSCSVHEAVNYRHNTVHIQNNFNNGLLDAAKCMNRIIYRGPKSSKRVYAECKAARTEARKRWRKFRSEERNTEKVEEIRERGEKHGKGGGSYAGGSSGAKRSTEKVEEIQQREARYRSTEKVEEIQERREKIHGKGRGNSGARREARKRWRKFRSKEKHGKGGGNSVQEQREARKRWRKFRSKEKHGKGGENSGVKRSTEKVEEIQE